MVKGGESGWKQLSIPLLTVELLNMKKCIPFSMDYEIYFTGTQISCMGYHYFFADS